LKEDEDREAALKQGRGVFGFTIENEQGQTDSWHTDLEEKGVAGKGLGEKPIVTLQLSDADFQKLIDGKGNAQSMYISGKLQLKGNIMAAQRLSPILAKAKGGPTKAKL
jgi:putative sterol carrier protein